jgi:hypothetical protein
MARRPFEKLPAAVERRVQRAVARVLSGEVSATQAARDARVPRTTVQSRLTRQGVRTRPGADPTARRLLHTLVHRDKVLVGDASQLLGISRATAYRWLRKTRTEVVR